MLALMAGRNVGEGITFVQDNKARISSRKRQTL
jgi:hypothetical protein